MTATLTARRPLGATGLNVSPICLGGNVFGWTAGERESFAVLDTFRELGGNFIDTANVYSAWVPGNSGGESETIIGRWMRSRMVRDEMVIATKVGYPGPPAFPEGLTPAQIRDNVRQSLERLQIDTIDVYYAHKDDPRTPLIDSLTMFDELLKAGTIRAVASSNYTAERLREALEVSDAAGIAGFTAHQPHFNLLDRAGYVGDLEDLCRTRGLGVAPYFALARGFLSGKYRPSGEIPASACAAGVQKDYMNPRGWGMLEALDAIAAAHGATDAQVAIAWLMCRPGITSPVVSATTPAQLIELAGAAQLELSPDEIAILDAAGA
jgi:aryl-alcohol dehydrogenase-like predicted oxidoreductase